MSDHDMDAYMPGAEEPSNAELDALVHEKVMERTWDESKCRVCGWPLDRDSGWCLPNNCSRRPPPKERADAIPPYSSSWEYTGLVIEELDVYFSVSRNLCKVYCAEVGRAGPKGLLGGRGHGSTRLRSLCLAMLAAVEAV